MKTLLVALLVASPALAQNEVSDASPDAATLAEQPLTIDVNPGVWLTRISGTAQNGPQFMNLGNGSRTLGLSEIDAGFLGEMTVSRGEWGVQLYGAHARWSGDASVHGVTQWGSATLVPGTTYSSSFSMSLIGLEAQWNPLTLAGDGRRDTIDDLEVICGPNLGINWLQIDQSVDTVDTNGTWGTVYGGMQIDTTVDLRHVADWLHTMTVGFHGSVGSTVTGGGLFFKVGGGVTINFTPNIGASIGYRLMEYNALKQGSWQVDPSFPGLLIGLNVAF